MNEIPTPLSPGPIKKSPSPLFIAIISSTIVGGLMGGLVGYSVVNGGLLTNTNNNSITSRSATLSVQEESATVEVVDQTNPAVVSIIQTKDYSKIYSQPQSPLDQFFGFQYQQPVPQGQQEVGQGSGFIVKADGTIVTNKHVADDEQAEYTVVMNDGKRYDAQVLAKDPVNDVAIIKIDANDLPTLTLGDSNNVKIGQTVIAIGNALGQYRNTVTKGVISGKSRTITAGDSSGQTETLEDVFQTDAAINPGNSGGPLLDLSGQVVAVNTAVSQSGQLIGFAIPINVIKRDLESIQKSGKIVQPYLGVRYTMITKSLADQNKLPVDHGAVLTSGQTSDELAVIPGSPADKAGLVENDIIVEINSIVLSADRSLAGALSQYKPGDVVTLKIYHQGDQQEIKATLGERT